MKTKISKIFNVISYIFVAVVVTVAIFCLYDCFKFKNSVDFWYIAHANAKYLLTVSSIGIVFPLVTYIANFHDQENVKFKNRSEVFMSVFIIGIIISVVLLVSPIQFNF